MADRERKSERPAERNLKEVPTREKAASKPSSPGKKTGPRSSEDLWIRQKDPAEEALQSESGRPSTQKRIVRYQKEHPSEGAVRTRESGLKATRQEAAQTTESDPHELQRRQQTRNSKFRR